MAPLSVINMPAVDNSRSRVFADTPRLIYHLTVSLHEVFADL